MNPLKKFIVRATVGIAAIAMALAVVSVFATEFTTPAQAAGAQVVPQIVTPETGVIIGNLVKISGTGEPGSMVTVTDETSTTVCATLAVADENNVGQWSCDTVTLAGGAHELTATSMDGDGKTSESTSVKVMVASTNPPLSQGCSKSQNVAFVVDLSGSMDPQNGTPPEKTSLYKLKKAATDYVNELAQQGSDVQIALFTFGTNAPNVITDDPKDYERTKYNTNLPLTSVNDETGVDSLTTAIDNWKGAGWTRWDLGLQSVATDSTNSGVHYDYVIFITDGYPSLDGKDTFQDPTGSIAAANNVKAMGTRIIVIYAATGSETLDSDQEKKVWAISGKSTPEKPDVVSDDLSYDYYELGWGQVSAQLTKLAKICTPTTPPDVPVVTTANITTISGVVKDDAVSVTVTVEGVEDPVTVEVQEDGSWSVPTPQGATDGAMVTAIATDGSGNKSAPATKALDFTVPGTPSIDVANKTEIGGTAEDATTVVVTIPGLTDPVTVPVVDGHWSIETPEGATDGATVSVVAVNEAGNPSPEATRDLDLTAPDVPVVTTANITTISGTAEPGATVTVTIPTEDGPVVRTATADESDGSWSVETPAGATDGGTVSAVAKDPAGNESAPAEKDLDVTAPEVPSIDVANKTEISGTAEPGTPKVIVTVEGVDTPFEATPDLYGNWKISTPAGAKDGDIVTAIAVDLAGNSSEKDTKALDFTTPGKPTIDVANKTTIGGTAKDATTVVVTIPGLTDPVTVPVDEDGNWSMETPQGATDGGTVSAVAVNEAGNPSPEATRVLDLTPPGAPEIKVANITTISGSSKPGTATVTVTVEGVEDPVTVKVDEDGNWTIPTPQGATDGATVTAIATDAAGNDSTPVTKALDMVAPVKPSIDVANITTISGTAEGATIVVVTIPGITEPVTVSVENGNWTMKTPEGAKEGTVTAVAFDDAGNPSPEAAKNLDLTPPGAPEITTANITTISGSSKEGTVSVTVTVEGVKDPVTVTVDENGNWTIPTPQGATDGATVTVVATDEAGNKSAPATKALDMVAPGVPSIDVANKTEISGTAKEGTVTVVVTVPGITDPITVTVDKDGKWSIPTPEGAKEGTVTAVAVDNAGNPSDGTSKYLDLTDPVAPSINALKTPVNDGSMRVTGTGEAGATVTVYDTDNTTIVCTATVQAGGSWGCDAKLAEGTHKLTAKQTDAAGNGPSLPSNTVEVTVDTQKPTDLMVTSPVKGGEVNTVRPEIVGTGDPDDTITVTGVDEKGEPIVVCTTTVDASGNWKCTSGTDLPEKETTLTVTETDPAGNVSEPTKVTFTVDTTAPSISIATVDRTQISGTTEPNATVQVTVPGVDGSILVTTTADKDGNWSVDVPADAKTGTVKVVAIDGAKNVTNPPAIATLDLNPGEPSITGANKEAISGTAGPDTAPGSKVVVTQDGKELCTATVADNGTWICETPEGATDGKIIVTVTDKKGDVSTSVEGYLDATDPDAPEVLTPTEGATSDNKPTVTGTGEPGAKVTVTDGNNVLCETTILDNGTYSCPIGTALPEGETTLTVTQTDNAGNASESTDVTLTVDTVAPSTPRVDVADGISVGGTEGSAEPGTTVTVTFPDGTTATTTVGEDGSWSVPTPEGMIHGTFTVTAADAAGNVSEQTTVVWAVEVQTGGTAQGVGSLPAAGIILFLVGAAIFAWSRRTVPTNK